MILGKILTSQPVTMLTACSNQVSGKFFSLSYAQNFTSHTSCTLVGYSLQGVVTHDCQRKWIKPHFATPAKYCFCKSIFLGVIDYNPLAITGFGIITPVKLFIVIPCRPFHKKLESLEGLTTVRGRALPSLRQKKCTVIQFCSDALPYPCA